MVKVLSVSLSEEFDDFIKLHNLSASQLLQEKIRETQNSMNSVYIQNLKKKMERLMLIIQNLNKEIEELKNVAKKG